MPTILLAEADRALRFAYHSFLSCHGFQVTTTDNGLECLAKFRRFVPDLLILDRDLPWGGGDGVLEILRKIHNSFPPRVLLTSTIDSAENLDRLDRLPGVQVLTKPFSMSALLEGASAATPEEDGPSSNGSLPGILVVDDDAAIRNLLQTYLQLRGFCVWTAEGGKKALEQCRDHGEAILVVLLDVQMPDMDGPQTLEGIQAITPEIPVCFMTSDPTSYDSSDLLGRGARHVFEKPFRLTGINLVVRNLAREPRGAASQLTTGADLDNLQRPPLIPFPKDRVSNDTEGKHHVSACQTNR